MKKKIQQLEKILKSLQKTFIEKLTICNQNGFMEMI